VYEPEGEDDVPFDAEVAIRSSCEDLDFEPAYRAPVPIRGISLRFRRDDIVNGADRRFDVVGYDDRITIEAAGDGEQRLDIDFNDTTRPLPGDYYYVRARLRNDDMLWSSPVYIGGFDHE